MRRSKRQALAKIFVHFYGNIANFNKVFTVKHFLREGHQRSTFYEIIKRYEASGSAQFKPLTGRKPSVSTDKMKKKVKKFFETKPKLPSEKLV
jgi:hypothetical protein